MEVKKFSIKYTDCFACGDEITNGYTVGDMDFCPECAFKHGLIDGDEYMHYIYDIAPSQRWKYRVVLHDGVIYWGTKNVKFEFELSESEKKSRELTRWRQTDEYKEWRRKVLEADHGMCRRCGSNQHLCAHHIVPVSVYPKWKLEPLNGVALCNSCHSYIHATHDRQWVIEDMRHGNWNTKNG